MLQNDVFEKKLIVIEFFHKIAADKADVIEFCKIEDVRFEQNGGRNIQRLTDFGEIVEKVRIGQPLLLFVDELFADFSVRDEFCPDFHAPCSFRPLRAREIFLLYYTENERKSKPKNGERVHSPKLFFREGECRRAGESGKRPGGRGNAEKAIGHGGNEEVRKAGEGNNARREGRCEKRREAGRCGRAESVKKHRREFGRA